MRFSAPITAFALLAPGALATSLPPCSTNSTLPCQCPSGTTYDQSVTFAVIGAAARDVTALISDFFHPDWFGIVPIKTQGQNNKPGARRTANLHTDYGIYALTEKLTEQQYDPKGGLIQRFEQWSATVPLEYHAHNGSFSGYWVTLDAEYVFADETSITWSVYACTTGHPINYKGFHEFALQNATDTLQKQGKITGTNVTPFTIEEPAVTA